MITAPMQDLDVIKVVLSNDINDILICRKLKENDVEYYTLIKIKDSYYTHKVLELILKSKDILNSDYIGMFTLDGCINLMFRYYNEQVLKTYGYIYIQNLQSRVKFAKSFIEKCVQTMLPLNFVYLMLDKNNINIDKDYNVYFNYFLDFSNLDSNITENDIYKKVSEICLSLLKDDYAMDNRNYQLPNEVVLFEKRIKTNTLSSYGQIYNEVNRIPLVTEQAPTLWGRIKNKYFEYKTRIARFSIFIIMALVISVSAYYCVNQIQARIEADKLKDVITTQAYDGVDKIGDVNLKE